MGKKNLSINYRVCGDHFTLSMYKPPAFKKLIDTAFPIEFIPRPGSDATVSPPLYEVRLS